MKTFHEWLRERQKQQEGLLLGSDGRLEGMSPANPLPKGSAFNKSLSKKPKQPPSGVPVFKPWKPAQPADFQHADHSKGVNVNVKILSSRQRQANSMMSAI